MAGIVMFFLTDAAIALFFFSEMAARPGSFLIANLLATPQS